MAVEETAREEKGAEEMAVEETAREEKGIEEMAVAEGAAVERTAENRTRVVLRQTGPCL